MKRYLSVCSGIEAASVAWGSLGWQPVGFSEIEPFPCSVLNHRFPDVKNFGDMTKYKEWGIDAGTVDVLVGGTPCQSFSVAGLRRGLEDPRGNLMLVYGAIAGYYKPSWIVWENVPGVLSSNGGRDFGCFLGMLGQLGYGFSYRVLDAQYFGVAQRRRRVFVVGYLGDWRRAAAVLFESESMLGNPPPSRKPGKGVTGTISARTSGGGGLGTDFELGGGLQVAHTLRGEGFDASEDGSGRGTPLVPVAFALRGREGGAMPEIEGDVTGALRSSSGGSSRSYIATPCAIQAGAMRENPKSGPGGVGVQEHIAYTIEARSEVQAVCYDMRGNGDGNTVPTITGDHAGRPTDYTPVVMATGQGNAEITEGHAPTLNCNHEAPIVSIQDVREIEKQQNGRGWNDDGTAYTVDAMATQGVSVRSTVRRLTPRECERLQGFPDDWTRIPWRGTSAEDCPDGPRYKAIGNSMAVPVMNWIGKRIEFVEKEFEL